MEDHPPSVDEDASGGLSADFVMDVSSSPAFTYLDSLLQKGDLTKGEVDALKDQYSVLHSSVLEMYESEKQCLKQAKQLNQDLLAEKIKLEKLNIRKHEESQSSAALEKERGQTDSELSSMEEESSRLHLELAELEREQSELERGLEQCKRENAELVAPAFTQLESSISELEESVSRQSRATEGCKREKDALVSRLQELHEQTEELLEKRQQQRQYLGKIKADPERIGKQADVVAQAAENLEQEVADLERRLGECDGILGDQAEKKASMQEMGREMTRKLDLHRSTIEQRERDVDSVRKTLDEQKSRHQDLLARRVQVELSLKDERFALKEALVRQNAIKKDYEAHKRVLKKRMAQLDNVRATLPQLEANCSDLCATRTSFQSDNRAMAKKVAQLKQEVDIFVANFLRQEHIEQEKRETLGEQTAAIRAAERQLSLWAEEEHKQHKQAALLSAQREIRAREASKAHSQHKSALQDLRIKELTILDLTKKLTETNSKLREFSALYDCVKNERNKYVNLIQASSQALAEMKEKIKILENEVEILRNESISKDKALTKECLAHQTAQCQRDAARHELNKCQAVYRERQNQVEQQIVEIEKLNSIINGMERFMIRLKRQYEQAVEHRNYTGVQLIDRNDELCILYEKSNIQEEAYKRGQLGLRAQEEELRTIQLQIADLERGLQVARKRVPRVPELAHKVLELKKSLQAERSLTEKFCQELETPDNDDRWRALLGDDPDVEQLQAKLQVLEERLNAKKEQMLEKDLVLEEVAELALKLKVKATQGKKSALELAKAVNSFQARIKDTTRQMMALVSELSMYQATALKLEQEKTDKEKMLQDAEWKERNNQPPTEDAEYEWYRIERHLRQPKAPQKTVVTDPMAPVIKKPARTTAPPRPNAYIPDTGLSIPRPYGAQAPFKPQPAGSSMRHIRKPNIQQIII